MSIRKNLASAILIVAGVGVAGVALAADAPRSGRDSEYAVGKSVSPARQGQAVQGNGRGSVYATQRLGTPAAQQPSAATVAGNGRGSVFALGRS